jgi:hypothetical protein
VPGAPQVEGVGERADDAVDDRGGLGGSRQALAQDDELVASEPRHHVAGAHGAHEPAGDPAQQRVAGVVAEGVVDRLEVVQVDEHHGGAPRAPRRLGQRPGDVVQEQVPVGQPGQRVVQRLVADAGLRTAAGDRVGQDVRCRLQEVEVLAGERPRPRGVGAEDAHRVLQGADDRRRARHDPVAAQEPAAGEHVGAAVELVHHHGPVGLQRRARMRPVPRDAGGVDEVGRPAHGGPHDEAVLARGELEDLDERDVEGVGDELGGTGEEVGDGHALQRALPEPGDGGLLDRPAAELLLGPLAVGDVDDLRLHEQAVVQRGGPEADLDGKLRPVLAQGEEVPPGAHGPAVRVAAVVARAPARARAGSAGDQLLDAAADELVVGVAEHPQRCGIDDLDDARARRRRPPRSARPP